MTTLHIAPNSGSSGEYSAPSHTSAWFSTTVTIACARRAAFAVRGAYIYPYPYPYPYPYHCPTPAPVPYPCPYPYRRHP